MEKNKIDNNNNDNYNYNSKALIKEEGEEEEENGHDEADEEFREEFKCCVCLELLYKPVVLACGHISCFWCVKNTMNIWHESHCPVCRHPYNHFPSICQLLHFLLMKLYPVTYKIRERQVGEEEKRMGCFSPQFDHHLLGSHPSKGVYMLDSPLHSPSHQQTKLNQESRTIRGKSSSHMTSLDTTVECGDDTTSKSATSAETSEATTNASVQECRLLRDDLNHKDHYQVCMDDFPCTACKRMLFHPVVLNCGHVYCESCIIVPEDGNFRCPVCQSLHPHELPSVCLALEHFLEEQFPELHAERREALLKQTNCTTQAQQRAVRSSSFPNNVYSSWWIGSGPKVHVGVGCDFCGMSPIIGERYKCKDCVETIGFDLCEACYNNPVNIPGRFNQQHKPEHTFEIVPQASTSDLLFRMNAEFSDDDGSDILENLDDGFHTLISSGDAPPEGFEDDTDDLEDVSPDSLAYHLSLALDLDDDSDDPSLLDLT